MAKRRIKQLPGKRIHYQVIHPLVGSDNHFDSWMTMCEWAVEIAEQEAIKQLNGQLHDLTVKLSDELVASAVEYEPKVDN